MAPHVVERAERIATTAHAGQVDKVGEPYIGHPRRVASRVEDWGGSSSQIAAAWLHDVLEDTPITADDLAREGIPSDVVVMVQALTTSGEEPAQRYASRVVAVPGAVLVKRADLADNSDPVRLAKLSEATRDRLTAKYAAFAAMLEAASQTQENTPL